MLSFLQYTHILCSLNQGAAMMISATMSTGTILATASGFPIIDLKKPMPACSNIKQTLGIV